jgi:aminopeptidase N
MLESFLEQSTFEQGLRFYLTNHAYKNARTSDLWEALTHQALSEKKTNINVANIMDTWTSQMGYPVVNVHRNGNKIMAEQERFLFNPRSTIEEEFKSPYALAYHFSPVLLLL